MCRNTHLRQCHTATRQHQAGSHTAPQRSRHALILIEEIATFAKNLRAKVTLIMDVNAALAHLGLALPPPPTPGGNYTSAKTSGSIVYLSGVISQTPEGILTGTVGLDKTIDEAYAAARSCALLQLAVLQQHLGSLDKIKSILTVNGYVNSVPGFPESPKVINGASDLFLSLFGEPGRHVRAAIGVSGLPRNALVELQMTVEI
jgi:enamine deaminase RidA (YjgF/YER057c/UK114 family)